MAISLRRARLYREIALDKQRRPILKGKPAFIREQIVDSNGRVVRSRTRVFASKESAHAALAR